MAALSIRLQAVEKLLAGKARGDRDEIEAQRLAETMGFPVDVLLVPAKTAERRKLAQSLHAQGWSGSRIARTFRCCQKTVERWLAQ